MKLLRNNEFLNTPEQAKILTDFLLCNARMGLLPVFDLDGVLLDASHRIKLNADGSLNLDEYRANSTLANIMQDKALPLIEAVHALNREGLPYAISTARVLCSGSQALLAHHNIRPMLSMSRNGDTDRRKDHELKTAELKKNFRPDNWPKVLLIDDCASNCLAFRAMGAGAIKIARNTLA